MEESKRDLLDPIESELEQVSAPQNAIQTQQGDGKPLALAATGDGSGPGEPDTGP